MSVSAWYSTEDLFFFWQMRKYQLAGVQGRDKSHCIYIDVKNKPKPKPPQPTTFTWSKTGRFDWLLVHEYALYLKIISGVTIQPESNHLPTGFFVKVRLNKQSTVSKQWKNQSALGFQNSANISSGKDVANVVFQSKLVVEQGLEPKSPWLPVATFIPAPDIAVVTSIFCYGYN